MKNGIAKSLAVIGLATTLGVASSAYGADRSPDRSKERRDESRYSDRARKSNWEKGKEELVRALKTGEDRDFYRKELNKLGYQLTSINHDKPDYLEYEVVKGDQTYEIQMDLDNSRKVTKVEVSSNMWKADTTDQILKGKKTNTKNVSGPNRARYSDRDRKGNWQKGRDELSRALKTGEDRDFYRKELEKLGYKVTSVNSDKADYLEYEVVKGEQSYEIQIDMDKNSRKATKVDVDTNVWKAEATDRAVEANQKSAKKKGAEKSAPRERRSSL